MWSGWRRSASPTPALASAIFHRWWRVADPLLRHLHIGNLLVNAGVAGGLLLVAAI